MARKKKGSAETLSDQGKPMSKEDGKKPDRAPMPYNPQGTSPRYSSHSWTCKHRWKESTEIYADLGWHLDKFDIDTRQKETQEKIAELGIYEVVQLTEKYRQGLRIAVCHNCLQSDVVCLADPVDDPKTGQLMLPLGK